MARISEATYRQLLANLGNASVEATKPPRGMNQTERLYAAHLDDRKHAKWITDYRYESIKFRCAKRCWLAVDFLVALPDGRCELHECKGRKGDTYYAREDAQIKAKVCADLYPWWPFYVVWPDAGAWRYERL